MKILFAVPYFKNAAYLEQTLKSVMAQTHSEWEVRIFDDSVDPAESSAALQLVRSLAHPQIHYQKNPANLGMARNWNQGLEYGKNFDFVNLLHADDQLLPDYAKSIIEAARVYPQAKAFFCKTEIIDENGQSSFSFTDWYKKTLTRVPPSGYLELNGLDAIRTLIPGNYIFCPTLCFRSSALNEFSFDASLRMVLDFQLMLKAFLGSATAIGLYAKPLYQYRRHTENATNQLNQSLVRFDEESALYDWLAEKLSAQGQTELADEARKKRIILYNLMFLASKSFLMLQWNMTKRYLSAIWKYFR